MNNKLLYVIIALLVIIIAGGAFLFFGGKAPDDKNQGIGQPTPSASVSETPSVDTNLSEQPNRVKFNEFFSSIYLAKLPAGAKFEPSKIIKTSNFVIGDQFCMSINMKKQVLANTFSSAVYDVDAKQEIQPRGGAFPQAMGPGNSTGCQSLDQSAGKYEYKFYLNDDLVAVLPFEVK